MNPGRRAPPAHARVFFRGLTLKIMHVMRCGRFLLAVLLAHFSPGTARAQKQPAAKPGTSSVIGRVTDAKGSPVGYATVLLLQAKDSALVKGTVTAAGGTYTFGVSAAGEYLVEASFTGYQPAYSPRFHLSRGKPFRLAPLKMTPTQVALTGLTVKAKKPLYEQLIDRMVIHVKSSPMAATETVLDVLEKSPGIRVDRVNENISINGKDGVVVMINGRKQYMPESAFYQMLESLKASQVEKIELITVPPAKYDAEGNAGYINIVMASNPDMGFKGSYDLTMSYPYGEMPGADLNLNYRHPRFSFFGNFTYTRRKAKQIFGVDRTVGTAPDLRVTRTRDHRSAKTPEPLFRAGADYQIDSSTLIGVMASGLNRHWVMHSLNQTRIGSPQAVDTIIRAKTHEINHMENLTGNLHLEHTFKGERKLIADANYIYFMNNNPNRYDYAYYNGEGKPLFESLAASGKHTPIHFWVFSADYSGKIGDKMELDAGAKSSITRFVNDIRVSYDGKVQPDMSADYNLRENTHAVYGSLSWKLTDKTTMKGGLRYEYTTSELGSATTPHIVDRKYGELFPTFYFSQQLPAHQSLDFAYSRRINRPSINDLAPFTIFWDPSTLITGNPALQPSISDATEISYLVKNLMFKASYTHVAHAFSSFQQVDATTGKEVITVGNTRYMRYLTLTASVPVTITPWWSMQNTFTSDLEWVATDYNGVPLSRRGVDLNFNGSEDFTLPHDYSIELNGFYYSPGLDGVTRYSSYGMLSVGGTKKFKDKSSIGLSVASLLGSLSYWEKSRLEAQQFSSTSRFKFWARKLVLTYTRSFGDKALKVKRKWSTGSEQELNRVHQ